jgi:hypothetical protein
MIFLSYRVRKIKESAGGPSVSWERPCASRLRSLVGEWLYSPDPHKAVMPFVGV